MQQTPSKATRTKIQLSKPDGDGARDVAVAPTTDVRTSDRWSSKLKDEGDKREDGRAEAGEFNKLFH